MHASSRDRRPGFFTPGDKAKSRAREAVGHASAATASRTGRRTMASTGVPICRCFAPQSPRGLRLRSPVNSLPGEGRAQSRSSVDRLARQAQVLDRANEIIGLHKPSSSAGERSRECASAGGVGEGVEEVIHGVADVRQSNRVHLGVQQWELAAWVTRSLCNQRGKRGCADLSHAPLMILDITESWR